jgi:predicted Na+-dependent transporter
MSTFIARNMTPIVVLVGIAMGFMFPTVGLLWKNYVGILLILLMFFSYLRINAGDVRDSLRNGRPLALALFMTYVFLPLLALIGRMFFSPIFFLGILLAFASPPAAATAFWARNFKGDIAFALVVTATASVLAIITVPATMLLATGAILPFDPYPMVILLAEVILVPVTAVLLLRQAVRIDWARVTRQTSHVELVIVFLLIWGSIAPGIESVMINLVQFGLLNVFMFFCLGSGFGLSYLVSRKFGYERGITIGIATCVKNAGLSLVIGLSMFGSAVIPPLIANLVAQNLLIVSLQARFRNYLKGQSNDSCKED